MRKAYLSFDKSGTYVQGHGFTSGTLQDCEVVSPCQQNPAQFCHHYLSDGKLIPRPASPIPQKKVVGWSIKNCPAGTVIEIFDLLGEELLLELNAEGTEEFNLLDQGIYRVDVTAPLPAYPTKTKIEVK